MSKFDSTTLWEFFLIFCFTGMCDYQFLPTSSHEDGTVTDLLPDLLFDNITTLEDFNRDVELFLPPLVFSRIETPQMQVRNEQV
jgi:hypothetical protein